MRTVKFFDLKRVHGPIREEIIKELASVLDSNQYILGERVKTFEQNFARFHGVSYGVGVDSGTSALELALRALGVSQGDEVIVPANTFIATASAVSFVGAKPVLVDCDEYYNIKVDEIEKKITKKTRAIIPVHLYGQPADMNEIGNVAKRHDLKIIEDACQAHGAMYKGQHIGNFGDVSCFSFYPSTNLGGLGDGGMILTNDKNMAEQLTKLRNYGQSKKYYHEFLGYNRRLDAIQAAVLDLKLKHLPKWNKQRKEAAMLYRESLAGIKQMVLPLEKNDRMHVYYLFVVQAESRDRLIAHLESKGVETGIHYPVPIHLQEGYKLHEYGLGDFPITENYAKSIVSLPIFPGITAEEIGRVCDGIREFYK